MSDAATELVDDASERLSRFYRNRVTERICESMDRDLREGLPARMPTTEQEVNALIRTMAQDVQKAARALDTAAEALREAGAGKAAAVAKQAAREAHLAHTGLVGE